MSKASMYTILHASSYQHGAPTLKDWINRVKQTSRNHRSKPVSEPHTRLEVLTEGGTEGLGVLFHQTHVVKFWPDRIDIDDGTWNSTTTRQRINLALHYARVPIRVRSGRRGPNKGRMIGVSINTFNDIWEPVCDWYCPPIPYSFTWFGNPIDHKVTPEEVKEWMTFCKQSAAGRVKAEIVDKLGFEPFGPRASGLPKTVEEAEELNKLAIVAGFPNFAQAYETAGLDVRQLAEDDLEMLKAGLVDLLLDKQRSQ